MTPALYVITGGPGSGKSTLIHAFAAAGFATVPEAGRAIIQHQRLINGPALPHLDPAAFAAHMLSWDIRSFHEAASSPGPVFFDRAIPDSIGFLRLCRLPVPDHFLRAAELFGYKTRVFLAPPWPAIFTHDPERTQTLAVAEDTFHAMVETYTGFGYALVSLPLAPVSERVAFVRRQLGLTADPD